MNNLSESDSSQRALRRILPASGENPRGGGSGDAEPSSISKKRTVTPSACKACRKRKARCSAERPKCSACLSKGLDCEYDTTRPDETHTQALKRKFSQQQATLASFERFYYLLKSRPEQEAVDLLGRLRAGIEVETIVKDVEQGDALLQLASRPPNDPSYELPYRTNMAPFLEFPNNPYSCSFLYRATLGRSLGPQWEPSTKLESDVLQKPLYQQPYHVSEIVDNRFDAVDLSTWTKVSDDNALMRMLLRTYFQYDFPTWQFFHKDFFLDDLLAGSKRCSSSLLVNAILAAACHRDAAIKNRSHYWDPLTLGYRFLTEAKRLWDIEYDNGRLTTIQAACILVLTYNANALDKVGWSCLTQAISAGRDMNLFSNLPTQKSRRWQITRTITAWGVFNLQAALCLIFRRAPLLESPPGERTPESSFSSMMDYGELMIRYGESETVPTHLGLTFVTTCQFRRLENDVASHLYADGVNRSSTRRVDFLDRLDVILHNLPEPLSPLYAALPCHLHFLFSIHSAYIQLLAPLFSADNLSANYLDQTSFQKRAQDSFNHAKACLQTLLRLYFLRHGFENFSLVLMQTLALLGFQALDELSQSPRDPSSSEMARSTLVLCVKGLRQQGKSFYLAETMSYMLQAGIGAKDAHLIPNAPSREETEAQKRIMEQQVHAQWPIPVISFPHDPDKQRLGNLIRSYANLDIQDRNMSSNESSAASSPNIEDQ